MKTFFKMLWHYILIFVLMIERLLRGSKIRIMNKEQMNIVKGIKGPIIFAPTHCGKFDIQTLAEVLWRFRWSLLSGDPHFLPGTVEGYWLQFHGVIYVDRDDKEWRTRAKEEMITHLKNGGNLMLYPEGTWNLSPNLPMLPLFRGIADIAKETNATIIPFAQEIDDKNKTYYVKIGEPIYPTEDPLSILEDLRSQMAEMKWLLIEKLPFCKAEYDKEKIYTEWDKYIENRLSECSYMNFELIWKYARKEKWQIEREQIEADLSNICPTKRTAFLFNKRLKG
ncbi:MAG: 1-acyl-sn-glycerol-3-phosphate acyltransferase [Clostridia bacterium]|nr:1-acyl-sn-glycerol-3-phosphate acyltransferase [Clostridia bacterium]